MIVTYLPPLTRKGACPLAANIIFIILALAWANWTVARAQSQTIRGKLSVLGTGCATAGGVLGIWAWGSATVREWPMEPYLTYMFEQLLLYVALLLLAIGAILCILATSRNGLRPLAELLSRLRLTLSSRLKGLAVLALVLVIFIAVSGLCRVLSVPFPREFSRVDATQGAGKALIAYAEGLDLSKFFMASEIQEPPGYVDRRILRCYAARSWRFRLHVADNPGFRDEGWLRCAATVDHFNGKAAREGKSLLVTAANASPVVRVPGTYWYRDGNETTIRRGFIVRMSLSYGEMYANLGGAGFNLDEQCVIFDEGRQLVAILAPLVRMWRA